MRDLCPSLTIDGRAGPCEERWGQGTGEVGPEVHPGEQPLHERYLCALSLVGAVAVPKDSAVSSATISESVALPAAIR